MKRYVKFICFLVLLLIPIQIDACTNSDLSIQRELTNNINTLIEYDIVNDRPVFAITITNIPRDMRIVDLSTGQEYAGGNFAEHNELTIKGYSPGQTIRFEVFGYASCVGTVIVPISVIIRPFNPFSLDPICKNAREFNMCSRWEPVSVSRDVFVKRVEEFIDRRDERLAREELKPLELNSWEKALAFIGSNYIAIVIVVIVLVIMVAVIQKIAMKKNQFDFKI